MRKTSSSDGRLKGFGSIVACRSLTAVPHAARAAIPSLHASHPMRSIRTSGYNTSLRIGRSPLGTMMDASDAAAPTRDAREMLFYRRPDVHARTLFFHSGATRGRADSTTTQELAVPVQLVDMDGTTHVGMTPATATSHRFTETTVHPGATTDTRRGHRDDRLARLLVTTNALDDPSTKARLRAIKASFHATTLVCMLLSVVLLLPIDKFWSDGSMSDQDIGNRVENRRIPLLALSATSCFVGIAASCMESVVGLWVFVFGTIVCDACILVVYLPHAFYLLRLIIDVFLIYLVVEIRSYLVPSWFVTNFHRLRY